MKRRDLLTTIARGARKHGVDWRLERQGSDHEIWRCGAIVIQVPRHRELHEATARRIFLGLEPVLGRGWWRS
jgi:hypothetical protein